MSFEITKIKIRHVSPQKGLVGFVSLVLNDSLYLGNIAIFSRLNQPDKIRLVFPVKELSEGGKIQIIHPLTRGTYFDLEEAVANVYFKEIKEKCL